MDETETDESSLPSEQEKDILVVISNGVDLLLSVPCVL